jgi:hypothetical protein
LDGDEPVSRNRALRLIALLASLAVVGPFAMLGMSAARAATDCTTRKSGSVTITSCSNSYRSGGLTQCRSYYSGRVLKTSCR